MMMQMQKCLGQHSGTMGDDEKMIFGRPFC